MAMFLRLVELSRDLDRAAVQGLIEQRDYEELDWLITEHLLQEFCDRYPERITAQMVFRAAEQDDVLARALVGDVARYLGIAVANLINLFNPQRIILGGPIGRVGQVLLDPLREEVQRRAMAYPRSVVQITTNDLGPDTGAIGAAVLVLQRASELFFAGT